MIWPTVVVGVGGQGHAIANSVKERLVEFARARATPETERDAIEAVERSVRIFAIDIDHTATANGKPNPAGMLLLKPAAPDTTIKAKAGFLKEWWPSHIVAPGGFLAGAGAMRAKGRLAYYLLGKPHGETIVHAINDLKAGAAAAGLGIGGALPSFIYIVGSVSGGTGSGIILTLAQHLRSLVDDDVHIIGAIPLASIMQKGPGAAGRENIYANCSAALREIDWWMLPEQYRPADISPFFVLNETPIRSDGSDLKNATPFDLCYLFSETNRAGQPLSSFADYSTLIADCIALDIDSPAAGAAQALIANILGPLNAKVSQPTDDYSSVRKSILFAGAGAASIVFSVPDTTAYLGDKLLLHILNSIVLPRYDRSADARQWLGDVGAIPITQQNKLHERLRAPSGTETGEDSYPLGQPPTLELGDEDRKEWGSIVRRQKAKFESVRLTRVDRVVTRNAVGATQDLSKALSDTVDTMLDAASGDGLRSASDFLHRVSDLLATRIEAVTSEISNLDPQQPGHVQKINERDLAYNKELDRLESGNGFPFGGKGKQQARAESFISSWWKPYVNLHEVHAVCRAEVSVLRGLREHVEYLRVHVDDALITMSQQRTVLENDLDEHFVSSKVQMAQQDRVLNDRELVDVVFDKAFRNAQTTEIQRLQNIASALTASGKPLRSWLQRTQSERESKSQEARRLKDATAAALDSASQAAALVFSDDVKRMSVWKAMEREYDARIALKKGDAFFAAMGGLPTDESSNDRVLQYMQTRVESCFAAAVPFWSLSSAQVAVHAQSFRVDNTQQASYSLEPFDEPGAGPVMLGLHDAISRQLIGASAPNNDGQSIYNFIVSSREWGAPLFMLNDDERSEMVNLEKSWTAKKGHVYIDQRYVGVLPDDLSLEGMQRRIDQLAEQKRHVAAATETVLRRVVQTVGLALELGYARENPMLQSFEVATSAAKNPYQRYAIDIYGAIRELHDHPDQLDNFAQLVHAEWSSLSDDERCAHVGNRIDTIDRHIGEMPLGSSPKKDTLQLMREAMVGLQQSMVTH